MIPLNALAVLWVLFEIGVLYLSFMYLIGCGMNKSDFVDTILQTDRVMAEAVFDALDGFAEDMSQAINIRVNEGRDTSAPVALNVISKVKDLLKESRDARLTKDIKKDDFLHERSTQLLMNTCRELRKLEELSCMDEELRMLYDTLYPCVDAYKDLQITARRTLQVQDRLKSCGLTKIMSKAVKDDLISSFGGTLSGIGDFLSNRTESDPGLGLDMDNPILKNLTTKHWGWQVRPG